MSKDEKKRRKQLVRAVRDEERRKLRDSLPVPVAVIKGLLNYVDSQLQITECDDTLQHVPRFHPYS